MTKFMTAFALAVALPAVANAQAAPAPAPQAGQSEKKMNCKCCKDMGGKDHAGHEMGKPGAKAPHADHQPSQQH